MQGQGEVEAGTVGARGPGRCLTDQSTKGEGRVIWKGSDRAADDVAAQVIRLNAAGTGTDAILKSVLLGPDGSPSGAGESLCGHRDGPHLFWRPERRRVWHGATEDYHWYNALDAEGCQGGAEHGAGVPGEERGI